MECAMVEAAIVRVHRQGRAQKGPQSQAIGKPRGGLTADKASDGTRIIAELSRRGAEVAISQRPRRKAPLAIDLDGTKWRHLIEYFFGKLKGFERAVMRSDETDAGFAAMIHLGAAVIYLR